MDNLLLVGVAIGGFLLLNNNNKENYEHRENFTILDPLVVNTTTEVEEEVDLLDMTKRSFKDFQYNYFIPNRTSDTQPMGGTGVSSGDFNSEDYDMGGDYAQIMSRTGGGFSSGPDPTYMSKANRPPPVPLFDPTSGLTYVNGVPNRKSELGRFKMDMKLKTKELPFEPIPVGPGTGIDANVTASCGFNSNLMTRVDLDRVFNHVTNQLPGEIIIGQSNSSIRPTANVNVSKNSNTTYYTIDKVPLLPNTGPDGSYTKASVEPPNRVGINVGFGKLNCN